MERVFDTCLLLFHLDFSGSADLDNRYTAGELRNTLLKLFAIVVRRRVLNLNTNFANATLDSFRITRTINDRGVVLVHGDALGITEVLKASVLEIKTDFLRDNRTACQNRDVLQHGLTTITEPRCFTCRNLYDAAHVVHNQRRERFAFNVFSNDDEWARSLSYLLKHRKQFTDV